MPAAIAQFLAQDRDDAELVILDDGNDPVSDLVPPDPRIRYVHETPRRALGDKRNRLCELARGDVIVHWDDDDWHAPDRLSRQLAALEESGADICGCDRLLFLAEDESAAWEYVYGGSRPWVAGGTLCYRRAVWEQRRFAAVRSGEDTTWIYAARGERLHVMPDNSFYVARVHRGNTSPKQIRGVWWKPRDVAVVRAMTVAAAPPLNPATTALGDLTVVVPHGGADRLALLKQTLAGLRQALPQSPIVVVELGLQAVAAEAAANANAHHLFEARDGEFERARALNLGSAEARTKYILWHDNDLVASPGFYARALAEAESAECDYLIPFLAVQYLGEDDTRAWLASGTRPAAARALRSLQSGPQASGGMGLVTREFVRRYGGLDERFRGWGGEDDAWWHKASLLGRAVFSRDPQQTAFHLFHPDSGGLAGAAPRQRNPHYSSNLAILGELQRIHTRETYLARYPSALPVRAQVSPAPQVPLFLYWEGPCPDWILRCRATILKHGGDVRLLDRAAFEELRADDRDINLDRLGPAHRADYVRAYLLARHGGIWLDSDCILMRPLDVVHAALATRGFVAHKDRQGYYPNGFIAAAPGNATADQFYRAVAQRLRAGQPLEWIALGGEPLTRLLRNDRASFHEFPCTAIQPICWSEPERFFRRADEAEHLRNFAPDALAYMLSNTQVAAYLKQHSGADLLAPDSFFSFIVAKSLDRAVQPAPAPAEAGHRQRPAEVFAEFHAAALTRTDDSLSGPGSSLAQTATLRHELPGLLRQLRVGTLLDAGCGDHRWLGSTELPVDRYLGVDIVPDLVARNSALGLPGRDFLLADFTHDEMPAADLVLMRDTLVLYDFATALRALRNLRRSGARWLLATTFPERKANRDSEIGSWRPINFTLAPFDFPPPVRLVREGCTENGGAYRDKALGLWRMHDLHC